MEYMTSRHILDFHIDVPSLGKALVMRTKHFVLYNMPTIVLDIEFELLGLHESNEFVLTIKMYSVTNDFQLGSSSIIFHFHKRFHEEGNIWGNRVHASPYSSSK